MPRDVMPGSALPVINIMGFGTLELGSMLRSIYCEMLPAARFKHR
jgi:hypothetical protein